MLLTESHSGYTVLIWEEPCSSKIKNLSVYPVKHLVSFKWKTFYDYLTSVSCILAMYLATTRDKITEHPFWYPPAISPWNLKNFSQLAVVSRDCYSWLPSWHIWKEEALGLHQIGLGTCLWGISLIDSWWRRASPTTCGANPGQIHLVCSRNLVKQKQEAAFLHSLWFSSGCQVPTLPIYTGFLSWWTVTDKLKQSSSSPDGFDQSFIKTTKSQLTPSNPVADFGV